MSKKNSANAVSAVSEVERLNAEIADCEQTIADAQLRVKELHTELTTNEFLADPEAYKAKIIAAALEAKATSGKGTGTRGPRVNTGISAAVTAAFSDGAEHTIQSVFDGLGGKYGRGPVAQACANLAHAKKLVKCGDATYRQATEADKAATPAAS